MMWAAMAAGLCLVVVGARHFGGSQISRASQNLYISVVKFRVAAVFGIGLGDHLHCAWFRKFPDQPPSYEALLTSMGNEYAPLVDVVRENVPEQYRLVMAHRCSYGGRKFVHLALRSDSNLASLVIASKESGESFDAAPHSTQHAAVMQFQIAAFESTSHLVYFISDLSAEGNASLFARMAPDVQRFLERVQG